MQENQLSSFNQALTWAIWIDSDYYRWDSNGLSLSNIGIHEDKINNYVQSEWVTLAVL